MKTTQYTITQKENNYSINGTEIPNEIFDEEKVDYRIEEREALIETLFDWIGDARGNDRRLMQDDLKMLMNIDDKYILSSISTNDYLFGNTEQFNLECENILNCIAI